mmetsp:Transcript_93551/g.269385  ORF Transcript_93551/g.269385 Transcript_93551/m.269385 type:complete len:278 (+) Transcript_93551:173-1006(+)
MQLPGRAGVADEVRGGNLAACSLDARSSRPSETPAPSASTTAPPAPTEQLPQAKSATPGQGYQVGCTEAPSPEQAAQAAGGARAEAASVPMPGTVADTGSGESLVGGRGGGTHGRAPAKASASRATPAACAAAHRRSVTSLSVDSNGQAARSAQPPAGVPGAAAAGSKRAKTASNSSRNPCEAASTPAAKAAALPYGPGDGPAPSWPRALSSCGSAVAKIRATSDMHASSGSTASPEAGAARSSAANAASLSLSRCSASCWPSLWRRSPRSWLIKPA